MREIVFYFAMIHHGDWNKIYQSINKKERINEEKLKELKDLKLNYITIIDEDYPEFLKHIPYPPYVLFYKGNINLLKEKKRIGVVGTRKMSEYGKRMTNKLIPPLVENDYVIVSGLAKGIDGEAHSACLENHGKTIAVVANGLDISYPSSNAGLYKKIEKEGLILSEYPPTVNPEPNFFHMRNRLIAGISQGLLVVEAYHRSGTLITIRYALEEGKDVYCVPARADEGSICNRIIHDGGNLVESVNDIIDGNFY